LALAKHALVAETPMHACNFGPGAEGDRSVEELVRSMAAFDSTRRWVARRSADQHEARALALAIDRARHALNWRPLLSFDESAAWTNAAYVAPRHAVADVVQRQIAEYATRAGT
jgi:CDP-glucose 4,6-dehydratase